MRIHCTVRRSATRIHCTVRAINSQCAVRAVNIHVWSDSIASPFCNLFAWKFFPEWKHFVVSINVPPPQLWGGQHTEMFVNHVTVFSQSVSHIRLSHTILCIVGCLKSSNFSLFLFFFYFLFLLISMCRYALLPLLSYQSTLFTTLPVAVVMVHRFLEEVHLHAWLQVFLLVWPLLEWLPVWRTYFPWKLFSILYYVVPSSDHLYSHVNNDGIYNEPRMFFAGGKEHKA